MDSAPAVLLLSGHGVLAAGLGVAGVAQGYGLYLAAAQVERWQRGRFGGVRLRLVVIVGGLLCLWPELTRVGDWLVARSADQGELVWVLIVGTLVGTVLPRPARRRVVPGDASMDEREAD